MALKLRRGSNAQRLAITPEEGELIYTTDTKAVYVGDGSTVGGTAVTSAAANHFSTIVVAGQSNIVADSTADSLTVAAGSGITLTTDAGTDTLTITNSGFSNLVEDLNPQLGGNLDLNGNIITTSVTNGDITISPDGTGRIFVTSGISRLTGNINIAPLSGLTVIGDAPNSVDGNLYIVRNTYSSSAATGFVFAQHHNTAEAVNFSFFRSRGDSSAQTKVLAGDRLGNIVFSGYDGTQALGGAVIQATSVATSSTNFLRTNLRFLTSNGAFPTPHLELTYEGFLKVKTLQAYSGTNINISTSNSLVIGGISLNQNGLSTTASNQNIILDPNGTGNVTILGNLEVSGTLGYQTGVGGSVVQLTDKTTSVTLDKPCGSIQLASQSIAAGAEVSFIFYNSYITDRDVVAVSIRSNASAGTYVAQCDLVDNGQCRISLSNISSGPIDQQVVLNFVIIKSVAA